MDAFHRLSQLSMKERASLIRQSAAKLVEDALSRLLGNNMLFLDTQTLASSSPSGCWP